MNQYHHQMSFLVMVLLFIVNVVPAQETSKAKNVRRPMVPTDDAIKQFAKRVELNERDTASRSVLGQLYLRRAKEQDRFHDFIAAEQHFVKIVESKPESRSARSLLAYSLLSQHRFREACALTKELLNSNPDDKTCLAMNADALIQLGDYKEAKEKIDHLLKLSRTPNSLVRLAAYQELFGQTSESLATMKDAVDSQMQLGDTDDRNAWYQLRHAQMLFDAGRIKQAEEELAAALRSKKDYSQALSLLAKIRVAQDRTDEAIELYQRSLQLAEAPPTLIDLGDLKISLGQNNEAQELFASAEKMMEEEEQDPLAGPPHARERAVYFSNHNKRLKHAVKLARQDMQTRKDVWTHDTLAWALYQNDEFDEALKHSRKSLATGTRNAQVLYHSGLIEIANGNTGKGKELLQDALKANPYFCKESVKEVDRILSLE